MVVTVLLLRSISAWGAVLVTLRRGHDVRIITSRFRSGETNHAAFVERVGYNILIPFNRAFVDLTVGVALRHRLRQLLREHEFDVLHTHCPTSPSLPILAIQTASCPQVGTFHTTAGRSSASSRTISSTSTNGLVR